MNKACLVINVWTEGKRRLPDDLSEALVIHLEHITGLCGQGYTSGEVTDEQFSGWWSIKNDENIKL